MSANAPVCPYCGADAEMVGGSVLFPRRQSLHIRNFWRCDACDAHVGCHDASPVEDGTRPLGSLANAELRKARVAAHSAFDRLWREGRMPRWRAYRWLARRLKIPVDEAHIALFDVETCILAEMICLEVVGREKNR